MHTDPDLKALVAADPAADVELTSAEAHVYLTAALASAQTRTPLATGQTRWRRRLTKVAVGLLGVTVLVPAVAYGGNYLALTGEYEGKHGNPLNEEVDILKSDFVDYAVTQWPDQAVLPTGYRPAVFARTVATELKKGLSANEMASGAPGVLLTVQNLRAIFEESAHCVWMEEWLSVDAAGDRTSAEHAAEVLDESSTWPATVALSDKGGLQLSKEIADAARIGDRAPVAEYVATNCVDYTSYEGARR
jgi:hypothetical protein